MANTNALEGHIKHLKQQHASQLKDMQALLDRQSDRIDALVSQTDALQINSTNAHRAADSATQQLSICEKKLATAKAELSAAASTHTSMHLQLHDAESKLQAADKAAKHAADKDVNMQQQLAALKRKLESSSNEPEISRLQSQLEQAYKDVELLRDETQTGLNLCCCENDGLSTVRLSVVHKNV